jgi:hypothetical protein
VKLRRQRADAKHKNEKIERIQRPPKKTCKEGISLYRRQTAKVSKKVHDLPVHPKRVSFARDANIRFSISNRKLTIANSPMSDLPQRQATDALMLTGFWYRALPADRV